MSLCTVCGRYLCDHTAAQRGQTTEELRRPMNAEETKLWKTEPDGSQKLIELARKNAHLPVP